MMKNDPNEHVFSDFVQLKSFLGSAGIDAKLLAFPVGFSLGVGLLEALGVWLLVKLAQGLLSLDYSFIKVTPAFSTIVAFLPPKLVISNAMLFMTLVTFIFLVFLVKNVMLYLSSASIFHFMRRFSNGMRKLLVSRCLSFGKMYFDRTSTGYLQRVLLEYTDKVAYRLTDIHQLLTCLFMLLAYLIMMCYISVKMTLFVIAAFPILHYSSNWLNKRIRKVSVECIDAQSHQSKGLFNILASIPLIKSYCTEPHELVTFSRDSDKVEKLEFSTDKKVLLVLPIQEVVALSLMLFLVSAIALLVSKQGAARLPGFFVYFYIIRRAATTFGTMSQFRGTLSSLQGPIVEILRLLDDDGKYFVKSGAKPFPGLKSKIQFVDVDYSYPDGTPVLKGVSFTISKGTMTAIVGPSGAGKTTIISLLLRFYECPPASIMIDGEDIKSFSFESLRGSFALVAQETMLFNDTLYNNIVYGMGTGDTSKRFEEVVRKARLAGYISKLSDGRDTLIGDRGVQLSGGEKQRVSIARAMLKSSEILIFDEATSALDTNTETLIQGAIDEIIRGKTAIVIAHRLSTIKKADNIIVLDDGHVIEEGSMSDLLARKGRFYQYWEEQRFK